MPSRPYIIWHLAKEHNTTQHSSSWFFNYKSIWCIVLESRLNVNATANASSPSFYHLISLLLLFILKRSQYSVSCFIYKAYDFAVLEFIIQFVSTVQHSGGNLQGDHRLQIINSKHNWNVAIFIRIPWVSMPNHLSLFLNWNFVINYFLSNPSQLIVNGEWEGLN